MDVNMVGWGVRAGGVFGLVGCLGWWSVRAGGVFGLVGCLVRGLVGLGPGRGEGLLLPLFLGVLWRAPRTALVVAWPSPRPGPAGWGGTRLDGDLWGWERAALFAPPGVCWRRSRFGVLALSRSPCFAEAWGAPAAGFWERLRRAFGERLRRAFGGAPAAGFRGAPAAGFKERLRRASRIGDYVGNPGGVVRGAFYLSVDAVGFVGLAVGAFPVDGCFGEAGVL